MLQLKPLNILQTLSYTNCFADLKTKFVLSCAKKIKAGYNLSGIASNFNFCLTGVKFGSAKQFQNMFDSLCTCKPRFLWFYGKNMNILTLKLFHLKLYSPATFAYSSMFPSLINVTNQKNMAFFTS